MHEIARKGWQQRAAENDDRTSVELTDRERAEREHDRIRRWAADYGPYRETLTLIERGICTTAELATETSMSRTAMRTRLRLLRQAGLVKPGEPLRSRLQRYYLTPDGTTLLLKVPNVPPTPEDG